MKISATATLKTKKDQSIRRFHPWIFSGAIKDWEGEAKDGEIVAVKSNKGGHLGYGYFQDQSSICIRMLTFGEEELNDDFWNNCLERAWQRREKLGLIDNPDNSLYRLVFAEGDSLPGLIIDMYDNHAVLQCYAMATYNIRELVCDFLKSKLGDKLKSVYVKIPEYIRLANGLENECIYGDDPDLCTATEHGTKYWINWKTGQKTGFFIDQRDNRKFLGSLSKGKKVLNTFCYSGGFTMEALKGGAKEVHSLDSSELALEELEKNLALNNLVSEKHRTIKADAMDYLKEMDTDYDIIVLDPPAFAKSISSRHKAIQGYKRLNARAIEHIKPGGIILTFSCSQVVDKFLFNSTILAAAIASGRRIQVIGQLHQPADHPFSIFHPEGEYLNGLAIQVD